MKKGNSTKVLMLILALVMVAPLVFAGGQGEGGAGDEPRPMRFVVPGTAPQQMDVGLAAVNEKLAEDGMNMEVTEIYIPWDAWTNKTNVMLSSGEEFELINIMDNSFTTTQDYAARGALYPLDELLDEQVPELRDKISPLLWSGATYQGEIYSVPVDRKSLRGALGQIGWLSVRSDLLEKYDLPVPSDRWELLEVMEELQDRYEADTGRKAYFWDHENTRAPNWLHRDYDSYPFYVDFTEELVYVDMDGNVQAWIETDEFRMNAEWYREAYTRGLIHPDILSLPRDYRVKEAEQGHFLFGGGTNGYSQYPRFSQNVPGIDIHQFLLGEDKPFFVFNILQNSNGVPITTDQPEVGLEFLNWLYDSKENHDLFIYGIEGEHFNADGDRFIEVIRDGTGAALYQTAEWMIGKSELVRFSKPVHPNYIETFTKPLEEGEYVTSPNLNFSFNSEPVASEYANLLAERQTSIWPLKFGVVSWDEYYETALENMKAAGLDEYIAEYQRQFDIWKAEQN